MLIACSGAAPALQDPDQLASQKTWVLASWTADSEILTKAKSRPAISFLEGKYLASPGINTMKGTYTARRDGSIVIPAGALTEMAGDPSTMEAEALFVKLLGRVTRWKVTNKVLILSDRATRLEMRFEVPKPVKALPLVGTEWALEGFEERKNEAASDTALVAGTTISLSIGADGRATGSAGVNRYFGKAEVGQDDRITFGRMASTRRGGPPEAMAQERRYLKQLSLVSSWAIAGNSLILTSEDGSSALRFVAR